MRPLNKHEELRHKRILAEMNSRIGERQLLLWTFDAGGDYWHPYWDSYEYMVGFNSAIRNAHIVITQEEDGKFKIHRGQQYLPAFNPTNNGLWWQKQQAKERETRHKIAALHKDIRDFLGDPSAGIINNNEE